MRAAIKVDSCNGANVFRALDFASAGQSGVIIPGEPRSHHARRIGELISAKQIQIMKKLSRSAEIDIDHLSGELFECDTGELSKSAAESLIAVLEEMVAEMGSRRYLRLTG